MEVFSPCPVPVGRHFIHEVAELDEAYRNPILHLRSRQGVSVPGQFLHNSCTTLSQGLPGVSLQEPWTSSPLSLHVRWGLLLASFFSFFFYKLEASVDGFYGLYSQKQRLAGSHSTCFLVTTVP